MSSNKQVFLISNIRLHLGKGGGKAVAFHSLFIFSDIPTALLLLEIGQGFFWAKPLPIQIT